MFRLVELFREASDALGEDGTTPSTADLDFIAGALAEAEELAGRLVAERDEARADHDKVRDTLVDLKRFVADVEEAVRSTGPTAAEEVVGVYMGVRYAFDAGFSCEVVDEVRSAEARVVALVAENAELKARLEEGAGGVRLRADAVAEVDQPAAAAPNARGWRPIPFAVLDEYGPLSASAVVQEPRCVEEGHLPACVVVGANGAYWRDFGDYYSMCPVSTDNDPVNPVAVYKRVPLPISATSDGEVDEAVQVWEADGVVAGLDPEDAEATEGTEA